LQDPPRGGIFRDERAGRTRTDVHPPTATVMPPTSRAVPADGEQLHRLLLESLEDHAIFALDPEGCVVSWTPGAERVKGHPRDAVLGRHFSRFYPEEEVRAGTPAALLRAAAERPTEIEGWRVRGDGSRFWARETFTVLRGASGAPAGFAVVTRDRTARREAEERLHLRERQLSQAHRLARLGSWEWEVAENRVRWSDELYRIYGLEPQEFGATFAAYLERVHPDDRDAVRESIEAAVRAGRPFDFEERIVRADGEVRRLRSRGEVVTDADGRALRLIGACQDVTEQREAEEKALELAREQAARAAAEEEARRLEFLAESSALLASSLDYETTLRNVARLAVERVADWCAVDLLDAGGTLRRVAVEHPDPERVALAKRLHEAYPPDPDAPAGVPHVIRTGTMEVVDRIPEALLEASACDAGHLRLLRELGLRSYVAAPLTARGETFGALLFVNAESGRAFTPSEVTLARDLARRAAVAIDNARLVEELRDSNARLEEQAVELEMQAEELQAQAAHLEELMAEAEAANDELQTQSEQLQQMTAELEAANAHLQATNDALAARTGEAEQANRTKADFLATMSHELRTPLNAIFGYADLLELEVHGPVTDAQREALERIKRNQRHLLSLINDILNFAKLEAGRVELRIADVPLAETVAGMEALVEPQLRARGLAYEQAPCDPSVRVRGDRERLEQVLLNLLGNAIKFTEPGGRITVSTDAEGDRVRVRVRDTGCGIPPEKLDEIFDPFVQVDRRRGGESQQGVGLGLAISRELARAMGGDLAAASREGEGSVFTLTLLRGAREVEGSIFAGRDAATGEEGEAVRTGEGAA
jgi:PAS domain S-box-containing protein